MDNPQDWNKVVSFMKDHPKVFMDLMHEHTKLDKFANEAYRDTSVRMSKKMKFPLSSNDRALSVP